MTIFVGGELGLLHKWSITLIDMNLSKLSKRKYTIISAETGRRADKLQALLPDNLSKLSPNVLI